MKHITKHVLYCDPSLPQELVLRYDNQEQRVPQPRADQILSIIHHFIQDQPVDQLVVVNQAQSFTFLRVIITIFNTLAFSRNISLYSADATEPVAFLIPRYSAEPHITK